jgi:single-strand DNA-binding protein
MVALSSFPNAPGPALHQQTWSSYPLSTGSPRAARACRRGTAPWVVEVMDVKTDKKIDKVSEATDLASVAVNEVRLVGRLSRDPEMRVLPSGDQMWTFRVVVPRAPGGRTKQSVDVLDCAVWGGRVRASVASWSADDVVEVAGPMRKRFFSSGAGPASRVEVEVTSGRLVKRALTRREETG